LYEERLKEKCNEIEQLNQDLINLGDKMKNLEIRCKETEIREHKLNEQKEILESKLT